jgi:hypothetical protein
VCRPSRRAPGSQSERTSTVLHAAHASNANTQIAERLR